MDSDKPKKSEDRSKNEKHIPTKRPNGNKPDGVNCNYEYHDELCGPPSPKDRRDIKHSNACESFLDTIQDKKHVLDNDDLENNPKEVCFSSLLNTDASHSSYLQEHKLGTVITSDNEKHSHADHVVKSNSTKKNGQEVNFHHTDNLSIIEFGKDSTYETLETEKKALVDLSSKIFIDDVPGADTVVPVFSGKRSNENKPEGIKCNEDYFGELYGHPPPKRQRNVKNSNSYGPILDTIQDKKHVFDNNDFKNNPTEVYFDSLFHINPSHKSCPQEHKLGTVIASDHEKFIHADRVVRSNSTKKEDVQEIIFPHTDDLFTIEFKKDNTYETLENEIKVLAELCSKDFVAEAPGAQSVATVTSSGKDVATDWPLCKIFT